MKRLKFAYDVHCQQDSKDCPLVKPNSVHPDKKNDYNESVSGRAGFKVRKFTTA